MKFAKNNYTVESVLKGHPDKICDQISDAVLDLYLSNDINCHTAIECLGTADKIIVAGEINSNSSLSIDKYCIDVYKNITGSSDVKIINLLSQQSNQLIEATIKGGAGDQGIMYGYACNNQYNCLPYGYWLVNMISKRLDDYRDSCKLYLSDGKVQTIISDNNHINKLTLNLQHHDNIDLDELRSKIKANILFDINADEIEINPIGLFINGGIANDTGVTGRKIMIDTYGGLAPHGGGAFSGKDPSKVDRSAAYMCRFVAKNLVVNGLANECTISVAYEFGYEYPVMINVIVDGKEDKNILNMVKETFDFHPSAICERLNLRQTKYLPTATYGHFTDPLYPWESIINL